MIKSCKIKKLESIQLPDLNQLMYPSRNKGSNKKSAEVDDHQSTGLVYVRVRLVSSSHFTSPKMDATFRKHEKESLRTKSVGSGTWIIHSHSSICFWWDWQAHNHHVQ